MKGAAPATYCAGEMLKTERYGSGVGVALRRKTIQICIQRGLRRGGIRVVYQNRAVLGESNRIHCCGRRPVYRLL